MEHFKEYTLGGGVTIKPRIEPGGAFRAMGEWQIAESKVFDVFHHGKHKATAETWEQAKDMAFSLITMHVKRP